MYLYLFRIIAVGMVCVLVGLLGAIHSENARSAERREWAARPVIRWHRDPNGRVWVQLLDEPPRMYEPSVDAEEPPVVEEAN